MNQMDEKNTKITRPVYYDEFVCTADECPFTCCKEWKIAVDEKTCKKWENFKNPNRQKDSLASYVTKKDGADVIGLNKNGKCPFLQENELCSLVLSYGDEILSETCATFPRQTHDFLSHIEKSLVSCCPAVIDLMKKYPMEDLLDEIPEEKQSFLYRVRKILIELLKEKHYSLEEAILMSFYIITDIYRMATKNRGLIDLASYKSKEGQNKLAHVIRNLEGSFEETFIENNELFLDVIENYRKEGIYTEFLEEAAELAEDWSDEYSLELIWEKYTKYQGELSKYENLLKEIIIQDLFCNLMLPESDLESMVMMCEWSFMVYALIRHFLFIRWVLSDEKMSYELLRETVVIMERMTGYDEEDIKEYLNNSFESIIWDWGYLRLLIG